MDARPAAQTIACTTILVPLDVDGFAEPALEQARYLAVTSGAALVLLTTVPDRDDLARATGGMVSFAALGERQAVADQMMVELAAQARHPLSRVEGRICGGEEICTSNQDFFLHTAAKRRMLEWVTFWLSSRYLLSTC